MKPGEFNTRCKYQTYDPMDPAAKSYRDALETAVHIYQKPGEWTPRLERSGAALAGHVPALQARI